MLVLPKRLSYTESLFGNLKQAMEKLFAQVDRLSNDDFEKLINHVDRQKRRRARNILAEAQKQAARFVHDVQDLESRGVKHARPARYTNPHNHNQTWSGFGRAPGWFKAYLEAGGNKEDLVLS